MPHNSETNSLDKNEITIETLLKLIFQSTAPFMPPLFQQLLNASSLRGSEESPPVEPSIKDELWFVARQHTLSRKLNLQRSSEGESFLHKTWCTFITCLLNPELFRKQPVFFNILHMLQRFLVKSCSFGSMVLHLKEIKLPTTEFEPTSATYAVTLGLHFVAVVVMRFVEMLSSQQPNESVYICWMIEELSILFEKFQVPALSLTKSADGANSISNNALEFAGQQLSVAILLMYEAIEKWVEQHPEAVLIEKLFISDIKRVFGEEQMTPPTSEVLPEKERLTAICSRLQTAVTGFSEQTILGKALRPYEEHLKKIHEREASLCAILKSEDGDNRDAKVCAFLKDHSIETLGTLFKHWSSADAVNCFSLLLCSKPPLLESIRYLSGSQTFVAQLVSHISMITSPTNPQTILRFAFEHEQDELGMALLSFGASICQQDCCTPASQALLAKCPKTLHKIETLLNKYAEIVDQYFSTRYRTIKEMTDTESEELLTYLITLCYWQPREIDRNTLYLSELLSRKIIPDDSASTSSRRATARFNKLCTWVSQDIFFRICIAILELPDDETEEKTTALLALIAIAAEHLHWPADDLQKLMQANTDEKCDRLYERLSYQAAVFLRMNCLNRVSDYLKAKRVDSIIFGPCRVFYYDSLMQCERLSQAGKSKKDAFLSNWKTLQGDTLYQEELERRKKAAEEAGRQLELECAEKAPKPKKKKKKKGAVASSRSASQVANGAAASFKSATQAANGAVVLSESATQVANGAAASSRSVTQAANGVTLLVEQPISDAVASTAFGEKGLALSDTIPLPPQGETREATLEEELQQTRKELQQTQKELQQARRAYTASQRRNDRLEDVNQQLECTNRWLDKRCLGLSQELQECSGQLQERSEALDLLRERFSESEACFSDLQTRLFQSEATVVECYHQMQAQQLLCQQLQELQLQFQQAMMSITQPPVQQQMMSGAGMPLPSLWRQQEQSLHPHYLQAPHPQADQVHYRQRAQRRPR